MLVQGESGTGKELVARLLHYWSDRVGSPFVAVNCAALAPGVLESELFGHERGAFTGASQRAPAASSARTAARSSSTRSARCRADFQAKLLRVLQDGEVQRVGAAKPRHVDVRVVAATNRDLRDAIAAGRFREDLYFRLNVIPIQLAPLRERREDILPLARILPRRVTPSGRCALSAEAESRLRRTPGRATCASSRTRSSGRRSWRAARPSRPRTCCSSRRWRRVGDGRAVAPARRSRLRPNRWRSDAAAGNGTLQDALDRATAERLRGALRETGGRRAEAARLLGVERTTLYRLMKRFGIEG